MAYRYDIFVVPRDGIWHLEIEDDTCQRELLRTFAEQGAAIDHSRFLVEQLRETGDVASVHVCTTDGACCTLPMIGALNLH